MTKIQQPVAQYLEGMN